MNVVDFFLSWRGRMLFTLFFIDLSYALSILRLSKNVKYLTRYWFFSTWYSNAFLRKMIWGIDINKKKQQKCDFILKKVHLHFLSSSLYLWKKWNRKKIDYTIQLFPLQFFSICFQLRHIIRFNYSLCVI